MAGPFVMLSGAVSSWATPHDTIVALHAAMDATVTMSGGEVDTSVFAAAGVVNRSNIKGLRDWTATLSGHLATPVLGSAGSVAGLPYSLNMRSYDFTIEADAVESTVYSPTGNWRSYLAGLIRWGFSCEALVDNATALKLVGDTSEPVTATLTLSSSNTLSGSAFTTGAVVTGRLGELAVVRYTARGTGALTVAGTANIFPDAYTFVTPTASSLVLKLHEAGATDKTLTGDAFWTRINLRHNFGEAVQTTIEARGSGALTPA